MKGRDVQNMKDIFTFGSYISWDEESYFVDNLTNKQLLGTEAYVFPLDFTTRPE
jgi:hypothetical protein